MFVAVNIIINAFKKNSGGYITWQSNEKLNIADCDNAKNVKLIEYSKMGSVKHVRELLTHNININTGVGSGISV
jgi:hypothetical protein